ncbi:ABC transporter ATP-binding protein [Nonomuraea sp. NPDC050404]|uniref:ABC transporter ATP-binding protein n=1 Tax=Nonomuraea sp. NPDC050404 TaxID=3155783 RepID=UPI00340170BD
MRCEVAGRTILSDVDLDVAYGRMLAIVGVNGSGKTTLIRALTGLSRPAAGQVTIGGQNVADLRARRRAALIAYVAQEETPSEDLLVGEMVALGRIPHRPPWALGGRSERRIVLDALAAVGLAEVVDRRCGRLSGGERRRVMLARALAQRSELLVLDEPTNHLDIRHQVQLLRTVRRLGRTVVAAVHDLSLAATCFDEVAVLHAGTVLTVDTPWRALTPDVVRKVYGVPAAHVTDPATGRTHLVLGDGFDPDDPTRKASP